MFHSSGVGFIGDVSDQISRSSLITMRMCSNKIEDKRALTFRDLGSKIPQLINSSSHIVYGA